MKICLIDETGTGDGALSVLAARWGLEHDEDNLMALVLTPEHLELRKRDEPKLGGIFVDFVGGAMAHRRKFGGGRGEAVAKAVGIKGDYLPDVVDALYRDILPELDLVLWLIKADDRALSVDEYFWRHILHRGHQRKGLTGACCRLRHERRWQRVNHIAAINGQCLPVRQAGRGVGWCHPYSSNPGKCAPLPGRRSCGRPRNVRALLRPVPDTSGIK